MPSSEGFLVPGFARGSPMALFQAALGMESPGLGPAKVERKIRGRKALHMRGGASSDLADLHLGLQADCADESSEGPKPIENRFSYTRGGSAVEGYRHTKLRCFSSRHS